MIRRRRSFGLRAGAIRPRRSPVSTDVSLISLADRAPDAALISGLAVNDESAAVAFVRRFQGPVFGLAVSITRDHALAEDIAQEAFLRAWRAAGSYDVRRGSVLAWLLTITRNLAIDAIRARRSAPVEATELELPDQHHPDRRGTRRKRGTGGGHGRRSTPRAAATRAGPCGGACRDRRKDDGRGGRA